MTPAANEPRILGEGLLEVDYPHNPLDAAAYRWDDVVGLHSGEHYDGHDLTFPPDLAGVHATLVAVVNRPPRRLGYADLAIREGARTPAEGSEVLLGTGEVFIRDRLADGRPTRQPNTAVGIRTGLDGPAVRSLQGQWVRLELRT